MGNFSFSHSVFYSLIEISAIFINFKIVVCELFQLFGTGLITNLKYYLTNQTPYQIKIFSFVQTEADKNLNDWILQ